MTTKFQHAGLDWIPHTPGDAMPCPPDTKVRVLMRYEQEEGSYEGGETPTAAHEWEWGALHGGAIIGWHPVEEQPDPADVKMCCTWQPDSYFGTYDTACGKEIYFEFDPQNAYKFCPFCGMKIEFTKEETE